MLKQKLPQQEQGFTLVEVLVAILIITLFVTTAMQAVVIAATFKARARELAEATIWIQEDLETVKSNVASLQYTSLNTLAPVGTTSIIVNSVYGFRDGDVLKIGTAPSSTEHTIATGGINSTTKTITVVSALATSQPANQPVVATTRCTGVSTTPGLADHFTGLADHLRDWISDTDPSNGITDLTTGETVVETSKTSTTNKVFTLKRTTTISTTALPSAPPHNLLRVSYEVLTTSLPLKSIAKFNTEVIPDAAFQCP